MNTVKKLVPVLLLIILIVCIFLSSGAQSDKIRISQKELSVSAQVSDESIFVSTAERSEMKKLASSGMLEMYLDEKTMTVCLYDTISGTLYRSLPKNYAGGKPSVLSLDVLIDGREYTLTSQSDSFSFNCTEYEQIRDGVIITYSFRRSLEGNKKLDISVPVSYVLTDGALTASVECNKIYCGGKTVITSLEILPFFGADNSGKKGDYILLPDGCGAVLDLAENAETFEQISLKVYGEDPAVQGKNGANVLVGAFGRRHGESAFVCLISEGESLCEITADKALSTSGYNRVGASFTITPIKTEDKHVYVSKESYQGKAEVCYRFLSGDNADYIGMASAVRELLIRQGKLRENGIDKSNEYPFNLTLVMSEERAGEDSESYLHTLTSFNQAYELLSSLKAKGFTDTNVRLKGLYEKGSIKTQKALGTKQELSMMSSLCDDGSVRLYADSSLLEGSTGSAKSIVAEKLPHMNADRIKEGLGSYISAIRQQSFYGVCVNDAGRVLFSDFSQREVSLRENVKDSLADILASICASKSVMIENGNIYSIKYADSIIDIPSVSSLSKREYFRDVPFIQTILHGITDYSHEAANISNDSTMAMLKAAEYGALPHYEWHCSSDTDDKNSDKFYYMNTVSQAKAYYDKMNSDFAAFRNRRITGHEQIKKDVYLTRFGEDCTVYVNYGDSAVSVGGVTVDAKSYAVVN